MALTLELKPLKSLRSLTERERRVLLIGGVIALVLFFLAVVWPLDHGVARLERSVQKKQADLAWMRSVAPELAAAGPAPSASGEPLIVLVNESARQAGLQDALTATAPSGNGGLRVQMRKAPFDALIGWLARLHQQYGIRVQSATVSRAATEGLVDASLVLGKS